jgi:preprotein translocase subunit SecG
MQTVLLVAELIIAVALIIFVLLQRSEGGGLGMGSSSGGGMGGLFSPRGAADTLTRTTTVLAVLFFFTCLGLNLLALHGRNESSLSILDAPVNSTGTTPKPAAPTVPAGPQVPKPQ